MIPVIPWYFTLVVIATEIGIAVAVWGIVSLAARRSGLEPLVQRRVRIGSGVFFGAWLAGVLLLAPAPEALANRGPYYITPLIPLFFAASVATVVLASWRSPSFRRVLRAIPTPALHALQAWRILGVVFVALLAQGKLPAHFALPAGWGDIFVGLTAPLVGLALARRVHGARALAVSWNAFGLLDLVVAVGMGTGVLAPLLVPDLGSRVPPAAAMGTLPMLLVPAFAVPMSTLLHVLALAALRREARVSPRLSPSTIG
jgi:hypothetical protein